MMDPYEVGVIAFMILQLLAVAGRMYVRGIMLRAFGADDVACLVTLVLATAYDILLVILCSISGLKSIFDIRPVSNIIPTINIVLSVELLYVAATIALKIAFGLLLLRVMSTKTYIKVIIWSLMIINVVYGIAYWLLILLECGDPRLFAAKFPAGQCIPTPAINSLGYTHATLVAVTDLIFGALPVTFLWNCALSRSAKWSVCGVLALGSFGCVCTFIRIGWIHFLSAPTDDYLHTSRGIALMSSIEVSIGLTCISLATYRPLLRGLSRSFKPYGDTASTSYGRATMTDTGDQDVPLKSWAGSTEKEYQQHAISESDR